MDDTLFSVTIEGSPICPVVVLAGELDLHTAPKLEEALESALAEGAAEIVVDLAALEHIDSTGLGVLIATAKRLGDPLRLRVRRPNPPARKILELSGLDEYLGSV